MKNNLYKIVDNKLYLFLRASVQEIEKEMQYNWTDLGHYYVNGSSMNDLNMAIKIWNKIKIK